LPSNELWRQSHKASDQALKSAKLISLRLEDPAVHTGLFTNIAAITDNEHREFGGLVADQNRNPGMAVFGTRELFVILFDSQTLLPLRTVVINGSSFANGCAAVWDIRTELLFPVHLRDDVVEVVFETSDGRIADVEAKFENHKLTVTPIRICECVSHLLREGLKICFRWQQRISVTGCLFFKLKEPDRRLSLPRGRSQNPKTGKCRWVGNRESFDGIN
jgi:hypothetical protein